MDIALFPAPTLVRGTARRGTWSAPTTTPTNAAAGYRRLLRALAGPANTAPFSSPHNRRRHRRPLRHL